MVIVLKEVNVERYLLFIYSLPKKLFFTIYLTTTQLFVMISKSKMANYL